MEMMEPDSVMLAEALQRAPRLESPALWTTAAIDFIRGTTDLALEVISSVRYPFPPR
jgi:hypothetical protein